MFLGNRSGNNENDVAKLLSDHFEPLFVSGDVFNFDESNIEVLIHNDNPLAISEDEMLTSIEELKSPNSIGPDGNPSSFIKKFASILINPLHLLINNILASSIFRPAIKSQFIKRVIVQILKITYQLLFTVTFLKFSV